MKSIYKRYSVIFLAISAALTQIPTVMAGDDGVLAIVAASALIASQMKESTDEDSDTVAFIPSIGYEHKRLKFEQELRYQTTAPVGSWGTDAEFEVDLPTLNVSLTSAFKKTFVTLKYEKSITEGTTDVDETPFADETSYYFNIPGSVTEVDREDISLTMGYNIINSLNVFVGYMKGKTIITPALGCRPPAGLTDCADPAAIVNYAWGQHFVAAGAEDYEQEYEEKGPFIGASYAWQIAEIGTLSMSAAYAAMDGEYSDNFVNGGDFKYTGDSDGTSLGLTWTAPLGEASNYYIDLRRQEYDMDAKDDNGHFPGGTAKTVETMTGLTVGVQFYL